jgi:hypothetical protein
MFASALTIRIAGPSDSRTLAVLASLSSRSVPVAGRTLLAERDGIPVAAIALTSGSVLTDPLHPVPDAERLLKLTRYGILRQGGRSGAGRGLVRRVRTPNHRTPRRPQVEVVERGIDRRSDGDDRWSPRTPRASARIAEAGVKKAA